MFEDVARPVTNLDEPTRWIRPVARLRETARRLAGAGAGVHLTGHGGDEVLAVKPSYLHDLTRRRPALAREHLAGMRALRRWSTTATLRALADRRPYGPWLAAEADALTDPFPPANRPLFGWEYPLRLPPWVTGDAAAGLADELRRRAGTARPYAPTRAAHTTVDLARQLGAAVRLAETVTAGAGAVLQAPYLDDRVMEACLAVRPEERSSPWTYKPLMVEAMRGTMPEGSLDRATKGEFSDDFFRGQRRRRGQIAELFDRPLLAGLGLIDPATLRHMALAAYPPGLPWGALDATMAVENWLRARADWNLPRPRRPYASPRPRPPPEPRTRPGRRPPAHAAARPAAPTDRRTPVSLSLADGVSIARTDDGAVLLDERTGRYWRLNGSGARLLQALLDGRDTRQAALDAAAGATVPADRAARDAAGLVDKLRGAGLVTA